uniref:Tyrosine-protein phosphatase domain-containing protein n=1 Tax=Caenorhabditis tropicalis TaxID=1561998 RepID=A0A1I7UAG0_9PELO
MDDDSESREFLKSRHSLKTGEELLNAAVEVPNELSNAEKERYNEMAERESVMTYQKVMWKGEQFNQHPESSSNPVYFNQQVDDADLANLKKKCNAKQFLELHGCYPNESLVNFQHDRSDEIPSCYHVRRVKEDKLSMKFQDVIRDFKIIGRGGKEYIYDM